MAPKNLVVVRPQAAPLHMYLEFPCSRSCPVASPWNFLTTGADAEFTLPSQSLFNLAASNGSRWVFRIKAMSSFLGARYEICFLLHKTAHAIYGQCDNLLIFSVDCLLCILLLQKRQPLSFLGRAICNSKVIRKVKCPTYSGLDAGQETSSWVFVSLKVSRDGDYMHFPILQRSFPFYDMKTMFYLLLL